ncbi:hypothetical protein ACG33_08085 [Steroidobacter denitrificans]|uniref:Uncharacterized protein n=1 Tax=Steroidobacter denitrificans TaxID=465721 RepID=A0A127F9H1_STEDE|nr:hypothetical protein [Steroidobacter denitrificans]AMN47053.1 hypothetical protein ACG33_08085 [Steroidobacter denitrificans]
MSTLLGKLRHTDAHPAACRNGLRSNAKNSMDFQLCRTPPAGIHHDGNHDFMRSLAGVLA